MLRYLSIYIEAYHLILPNTTLCLQLLDNIVILQLIYKINLI